MVWMYLVTLFGFSFSILSMAEMSSMYVSGVYEIAYEDGH